MANKLELEVKQLDFDVMRGKAYRLTMTYKNKPSLTPFDLTNFKARFTARLSPDSVDAVVELTEADGITLGSGDGNIEIIIPGITETVSEIIYGFELEDVAGVVTPMLSGDISLIESIV